MGAFIEGFCWSLKQEECESWTTEQGTTRPPAEAKEQAKLRGVNGQACEAGHGGEKPHAPLQALACQKQEAPAGSLLSQQTPPAWSPGPSASVVDVEVESLVAKQGVGVVKLEQVDAFPGVVVAASLHVSVAVPPVHRHDLPVATPQGAPGASLHITGWDRVCMSKTAECLGMSSENTHKSYLKVGEWTR